MGGGANGNTRLAATVTGQVQGVGFRYWVRGEALRLELTGLAANQANGSVAVTAEGPPSSLRELLETLQSGKTPGRVERVDADFGPASGEFTGFRTA